MITKYNPNVKMERPPLPNVVAPLKTDRDGVNNKLKVQTQGVR